MKKILFSLVALVAATNVFGQEPEPTKLRDANLKGNVLAVQYGKFEYKENFGEPTAGDVRELNSTFYDEKGRSILYRTLSYGYDRTYAHSYLFEYADEGNNVKVSRPSLQTVNTRDVYTAYEQALLAANGAFEELMRTTPNKDNHNNTCFPYLLSEYTYDNAQVQILYDLKYSRDNKLKAKVVAKPIGGGMYEFTIYKENGEVGEKSKRTFKNGMLVKMEKERMGLIHYRGDIPSPEAGTYTYDTKGNLTHILLANNEERKYDFNEKGDIIKESKKVYKTWSNTFFYENYKYDEQGNWISRTVGSDAGKPQFIEKRVITYCSGADELKEKAAQVQATAGQAIKVEQ